MASTADLVSDWKLDDSASAQLDQAGMTAHKTSANSGLNVEEAFLQLARAVIA